MSSAERERVPGTAGELDPDAFVWVYSRTASAPFSRPIPDRIEDARREARLRHQGSELDGTIAATTPAGSCRA